uniref:GLUG domain protein n=1 Tax=Dictyoglomus turgidum TaxID=513050 RepID=A0A7C3WQK4_9BACT
MKRIIIIILFLSQNLLGQFAGGSGTQNDPYLISTAQQFNQIRNQGSNTTVYYKLINDINLDDLGVGSGGNWTPINISARVSLDGNGHVIRNMKMYYEVTSGNYIGLFSGATTIRVFNLSCKNFEIVDSTLNNNMTNSYIGFIAGRFGTSFSDFRNLLYRVIVDSSKIILKENYINMQNGVGGIIGYIGTTTLDSVKECAIRNTLIWTAGDGTSGAGFSTGAICGTIVEGVIQKCFAENVHIKGRRYLTSSGNLGAFLGYIGYSASSSGNVIIEDCFFKGKITLTTNSGGATVGFVTGVGYSGGSPNLIIRRCYSTTQFEGPAGGFTKLGWSGVSQNIFYSYFNYEICGTQKSASVLVNSDSAIAKLTAEMKTQSTYTTWDFDNTWAIDPSINEGYPYLRWAPLTKYDTLKFLSPYQNSLFVQGDTVKIKWYSSRDSVTLFVSFLQDSINVYNNTTYLLPLPDSAHKFNFTIIGKPITKNNVVPIPDTLFLSYLPNRYVEIDSLYINIYVLNPVNSGNFQKDLNAVLSSMIVDTVIHAKILSVGLDTLDVIFVTPDSILYRVGYYKVQDTTQIPNITYVEIPLRMFRKGIDACGMVRVGEKMAVVATTPIPEGGSSITGFSGTLGKSGKSSGVYSGAFTYLDIEKVLNYRFERIKVDIKKGKTLPSPCGSYFCCNYVGGLFSGIMYIDLTCGWYSSPQGWTSKDGKMVAWGYNFTGKKIELPIWIQPYHNKIVFEEEYHSDFVLQRSWYTFKYKVITVYGSTTFDWSWFDPGRSFSQSQVFSDYNYHPTSVLVKNPFIFFVNENNELVTQIILPHKTYEIKTFLPELSERGFQPPYDIEFEIIEGKPVLSISDSRDNALVMLLDDLFKLSTEEIEKLVNPVFMTKKISVNIINKQYLSQDVINYLSEKIQNCEFIYNSKRNYFRGIHPKIWKYGNPQGEKN